MSDLHQDKILKSLRDNGMRITRAELQEFLDNDNTSIPGLKIRPRGRGVDSGHENRWYNILSSDMDSNQANRRIVEYICKHGLR